MANQEIYFHVGLGKNASKFLQYNVFPKFKDITYIQRTRYRWVKSILQKLGKGRFLVSNEFDRQLERECKWFSADYPKAKVIMVIRRNDSWIASQYRRFIKNGVGYSFNQYIDLVGDSGEWKIKDLYLYEYIKTVERYFEHKPLVILYDQLKKSPQQTVQMMAEYVGAKVELNDINFNPKHTSYSEKQLKFMRKVAPTLFSVNRKDSKNLFLKALYRYSRWSLVYPVLYLGKIIPNAWLGDQPLIPTEELDKVRKFFEEDWQKCELYALESQKFHGF